MSEPNTEQSTNDPPRGCLYDGSAEIKTFDENELERVKEAIPPATRGGGFQVITRIRSANFSQGTQMTAPFGIVLHHTGGHFENDLAILTKPGTGVSANDLIDKQGRIFELCELPKRAWHAGEASLHGITDWNAHGWGIEIENLGTGSDPYPRQQIEAIIWRCRERRRRLGITDKKMLTRHRDICMPRGRKPDTSDNFPLEEIRRRVFAKTDPTDDGVVGGEFDMEKYNIAGLDRSSALIANAFAGALRTERIAAMAIHSKSNIRVAAEAAAGAPFRKGPRLVAIGSEAAGAVTKAGQKLGTEEKSDLFGAVGRGEGDALIKDTLTKTEGLLLQICEVEKKNPARAKERFQNALVGLAPGLQDKV
jgi:N-acetyl-anhydromuramyl-L-alanine amidase AmpD